MHGNTICTYNKHGRFIALNICRYYTIKLFTGKLSWCLVFKILKQHQHTKLVHLNKYSQETFAVILKTVKMQKIIIANLSTYMYGSYVE